MKPQEIKVMEYQHPTRQDIIDAYENCKGIIPPAKTKMEIVKEYFGDRLKKVFCFDIPETIKYSLDGITYTQNEIIKKYDDDNPTN